VRGGRSPWPSIGLLAAAAAVLAAAVAGVVVRWPLAAPLVAAFRLLRWSLTTAYAAAPVFAAGLLLTRKVLRLSGPLPPGWQLAAAWGSGWGAVVLAGTAMLACGLYHEAVWAVTALLGNLGLLAYLAMQRWRPLAELRADASAAWRHIRGRETFGVGVWGLAILGCLASALLLASIPPDARDELVYHLALPQFWRFQHDWWVPLDNVHWLFPANAELIWGYGLAVGGIHVPRLLTLAFGLATLALLAGMLAESGHDRWTARVSLLFLLLAPMSLVLLGTCNAEWPLLFFLFLGWRAARQFLASRQVAAAILAAAAWGLCLGFKYTAFLVVAGLGLEWLVALLRAGAIKPAARALAALAVASALFAGGWLLRNWSLTGDPLYPLGVDLISARGADPAGTPDVGSLLDYAKLQGFWRFAPWLYHATADPVVDQRLHLGWPLLLLGVAALGWRRAASLPWFTVTVASLVLLRYSPAPRAYIPVLALSWLFLPLFLQKLAGRRWLRVTASAVIGVLALSTLPWFYVVVTRYSPGAQHYLLGIIGDEELLRRSGVLTPCVSWIRMVSPEDARVWVWGGEQTFYLDRWARASSFLDTPLVLAWFERYGAEGFSRKLAESRVDFILVETANCPLPPTSIHTEGRDWPIAPSLQPVIARWMQGNLREVARDGSYVLYLVTARPRG
jgi:hypothetical protein